jgi:hypothetical protein
MSESKFTKEFIAECKDSIAASLAVRYIMKEDAEIFRDALDEIARLTARVRELVDEEETYYSSWKCGWCNERFPTQALALSHALSCETHPLVQRVRELEEEVKESNGLLRSTYQIASRDGKDTNWDAFKKQVYSALDRQHKMMYDKGEK